MITTASVPRTESAAAAAAARGEAILGQLGVRARPDPTALAGAIQPASPDPFSSRLIAGLAALLVAVHSREPRAAADAGRRLIGVGPGLTPLGDDYLVGSAIAVTALAGATGFPEPRRQSWLEALIPAKPGSRTTPLSGWILEMARIGRAALPPLAVLDLTPCTHAQLGRSVNRLVAIGASTGRGYAAAIGATALLLADARHVRKPAPCPEGDP